uniref:Protein sly1 homolog n=1 Tax=Anopheles culicifacies TaxID=139723 RepID=A0A182LSU9_9DIPT
MKRRLNVFSVRYLLVALVLVGFVKITEGNYNIPDELVQCYRGNGTLPGPPHTLPFLLELIRKIERHNPTTLDIRMLSAELIHRLRVDGIEKVPGVAETQWVTPHSPRGIMVPKYALQRQLVSNVPGRIDFDAFLTPFEICNLHRMLSSSVEPFQREDERITCPITLMSNDGNPQAPWITQNKSQKSNSNQTTFSRPLSRCPLERGTCHTVDYGTISPGVVIMSIAAGLQPQNVLISEFVTAYRKKNPYENLETMDKADTRKQLEKLFASLESIDNMYAAGLAGDLAEVCLYQGPALMRNVVIGLAGTWNDTYFPRARYLSESHAGRWEMTDSEILAGIDGFFLAQQTPELYKRLRRLRLSQVLEMFYSDRGIPVTAIETISHRRRIGFGHGKRPKTGSLKYPEKDHVTDQFSAKTMGNSRFHAVFDGEEMIEDGPTQQQSMDVTRACQRKDILRSIETDKLKQETYKFVELLEYTIGSVIIDDRLMQNICNATVDKFVDTANRLLDTLADCPTMSASEKFTTKPNVDLTIVLDGSRDEYRNLQLISYLVDLIDVSSYGSSISVVHGTTGQYMVNKTNSISTAFEQLLRFQGSFPQQLSLSKSFASIVTTLAAQMDAERSNFTVGSNAPVVLVLSQSNRITNTDFDSARRMLRGSFEQFPDLYFGFVTNDPATFRQLTNFNDTTHSRAAEEHYYIFEAAQTTIAIFSNEVAQMLQAIPQRLMAPNCHTASNRDFWRAAVVREEYEQYLTPGVELRYRLGQLFLRNSENVRVQFMNTNYGEFTVCEGRNHRAAPEYCQTTGPGEESLWFNHTRPCDGVMDQACRALYYTVRLESSNVLCNENDCRYPDQVRFVIRHEDAIKQMLNLNQPMTKAISAEPVWKLLIYDRAGQDIISPLISIRELREMGITLHIQLHSDRDSIPDVPAIYFCAATEENLGRIAQDFQNGLYDVYHLNFIAPISRQKLEDLAAAALQAGCVANIHKVYDQYLNFITLEDDMFVLKHQNSDALSYYAINRANTQDVEMENIMDSIVDSLFAVFVTLGTVPIIRCPKNSAAEMVARKLEKKLRENLWDARNNLFHMDATQTGAFSFQRPLLVLLDRSIDMATPLHHTWTYQALAHDVLELALNRVVVEEDPSADQQQYNATGAKPKMKACDLDSRDRFWCTHKGSPFPTVAEAIQEELEQYRSSEEEIKKLKTTMGIDGESDVAFSMVNDNTAKLTSAVNSLPQLLEKKRLIDMHTKIATSILNYIKARRLDSFFELEEKIMSKQALDRALIELLKDPEFGLPEDKMRLFIIYYICSNVTDAEFKRLEETLKECDCDLSPLPYIQRWKSIMKSTLTNSNQYEGSGTKTVSMFSKLVSQGSSFVMEGVKNLVVKRHNLPVTKITEQLMECRSGGSEVDDYLYLDPKLLKGSDVVPKNRSPFQDAIVFVVGGGNYIEYQNLVDFIKSKQSTNSIRRIIYGASTLTNAKQFLKQLSLLGQEIAGA